MGVPLVTQSQIYLLGDTILAMISVDCEVPQWAVDAYYNTLNKYMIGHFANIARNPRLAKIRGGPLVTEIVNNMVAVDQGSGKKVLIYSAHDLTVASLAVALGVGDQLPDRISYSDAIMVDLVEAKAGSLEPTVEVIYLSKANTIPERIPMALPGCGVSCTLTAFRAATSAMMVADWDQICAV